MTTMRCCCGLILFILSGCGSGGGSGGEQALSPAEDRLVKLGQAYLQAANQLGRAPKDVAEIKPYFDGGFTDEAIRSPNDGEEFVVLCGVDYNKLPLRRDDPFTVAAYEKRGVAGKRFVLRIPTRVEQLTDAELAKAVFPPGFQPPP